MDDLLQQGITAYKNDHRPEARQLLAAFLKQNMNSEAGWGWFFLVCETDQERLDCLIQIVRINPQNANAVQLLRQYSSPEQPPQPPASEENPPEAPKGGWLARKAGHFLESLQDGSFSQYIIHHPLVFLVDVILIAVLCFGGLFLIPGKGKPGASPAPATPVATATIQDTRAASLPPGKAPTPEIKATVLPKAATDGGTAVPVATVLPVGMGSANPLLVTFIDVGQGDAILIVAPDGQVGLIDGGSAGKGALAYLQAQGIQRIDLMVATHPDEEHIGGLVEVLNAMPVGKVFTSGQADTTPIYAQFLDAIAADKADYAQAVCNDTLNLGSLAFSVFCPAGSTAGSDHANSLELRFSFEKTTFLFMGDSDAQAEGGILAAGQPVQADILKVGHHAICAASSPAFLDAVHPLVAIYSPGVDNPGAYPCETTLNELNGRGVFVFGTDTGGPILASVTADGYTISDSSGVLFRK
jgi:competence protein ComEC